MTSVRRIAGVVTLAQSCAGRGVASGRTRGQVCQRWRGSIPGAHHFQRSPGTSRRRAALVTKIAVVLGLLSASAAQERILFIPGPGPTRGFGTQVVGAGDVDRDGTPDIVATTYDQVNWPPVSPVYFYSGRTGLRLGSPALDHPYDYDVVPLGDVTGDGYPEFAISGNTSYVFSPWYGVVHVLQGAFGCLAPAGDHDRDGANDVFAQITLGVGVFSGRTGQLLRNYAFGVPAGSRNLLGLGDVNGDGIHDFAVPEFTRGHINVQSGADGSNLSSIRTGQTSSFSIYALGDIDGDGTRELAYRGNPPMRLVILSGRNHAVLFELTTTGPDFVGEPASSGDLNQDGHDDFIVLETPGAIRVYSGRTLTVMYVIPVTPGSFDSGASLGDINGDGLPDFALGQPGHNSSLGAVAVYGPVRATLTEFGLGCVGAAGVPRLTSPAGPRVGELFELRVANLVPFSFAVLLIGGSNTAWGSLPLPADLSVVGMPTCQLLVSGDANVALFNTSGTASWQTTIPADYGLLHARFFTQCLPFDPGANVRGITASNGGDAVIGG